MAVYVHCVIDLPKVIKSMPNRKVVLRKLGICSKMLILACREC